MAFFCWHCRVRTPDRRPLEKYENFSCHQKPNFVLKSKVKCFSPTDRWLYWKTHENSLVSRLSSWSVFLVVCLVLILVICKWTNLIFYFAVLFNIITFPQCPFTNAFSHLGNDICLQKNAGSYQSPWHWHTFCISWINFPFFWRRTID